MEEQRQLAERLLSFLVSKASKPAWLAVVWLAATLAIGVAIGSSGLAPEPWIAWLIAAVLGLVASLAVRAYASPPRVERGKIGISFAISTEGEPDDKKVQFDLVRAVKRAIDERPTSIPFKVQLIPSRLFPDGMDREQAETLLRKTRSRFLLFGDLRKRKSKSAEGREVYSLRFMGMVSHAPTTAENSQMLGAEMSSVLPLKLDIDCNADLEGFEITSEQIANGAKYIVAVAYFLSNTPREAVLLLQSLQSAARDIARSPLPISKQLARLVERRLCDFQLHHASALHFEWRHSHAKELIEEAERIVTDLPKDSQERSDVQQ
jgi:hypothetical protein